MFGSLFQRQLPVTTCRFSVKTFTLKITITVTRVNFVSFYIVLVHTVQGPFRSLFCEYIECALIFLIALKPHRFRGAKDDANGEGSVAEKDALHGQQAMAWESAETCPVQVR
jgi:hypothetical protein